MPHCSTEAPGCHLHLSHDATHALAHTLHVGTARAHVHKAAHPLRSPSRGHRENRNVLDAGLKAESVRLYIARQVVTVFQNVSFTNNHRPCQKFFSMTAECSPYLYKLCQLSRFWKSGGKKVFCSIKLYCNEVPDRKIRPQGCDQWWSSMNKWVLSPSGWEWDLRGFRRAMCLLTSGSLVQL